MDEADSEFIRRQPNSRAAFNEARKMSDRVRKDWVSGNVNIMMVRAMQPSILLLSLTMNYRWRKSFCSNSPNTRALNVSF